MNRIVVTLLMLQVSVNVHSWSNGRYRSSLVNRTEMVRDRRVRTNAGPSGTTGECSYNVCEKVADYPEEEIEAIIRNNTALHSYFGGSVIEPDHRFLLTPRKWGGEPTPMCRTRDVSVAPRMLTDFEDNEERIIPNVKHFSQTLKYQLCDDQDNEYFSFIPLDNYKYGCVQKFTLLKLLTVDVHTRQLQHRKFRIPSHCACEYTYLN